MKFFKNSTSLVAVFFLILFLFLCFEIYIPANPTSHESVIFTVEKGWSDDQISNSLEKLGLIRSTNFFQFYVIVSLKHSSLQAGQYSLSSNMSTYAIANKIARGEVIRDSVAILEGWNIKDIGSYLSSKGICTQSEFIFLSKKDYSGEFEFLKDKPKNSSLEGYIFPDTYQIAKGETCEEILTAALGNFNKKLTPALRAEIKKQNKSIFDIVTMASLLEKEVRTMEDKKIVAGILWKRISIGMPLQLDSTVNYITNKNVPGVSIKDTKIDSPYNTYKYYGLPKGPISNPGMDSIMATIYPKSTKYLYYMTDGTTIFSETFAQHNAAIANHLAQ